jgi:hypothetical protein
LTGGRGDRKLPADRDGRTLEAMLRRRFRGVVTVLSFAGGVGAAAPAAWAQDAPPEAPPPAFVAPPPGYEPPTQYAQGAPPAPVAREIAPTFMTLDRMDASTRIGIQVGWDKIDPTSVSDAFLMRYEPYAQYVFPSQAGGVYAHVPISHVFDFRGADTTGLGNIDFGGFFMPTHNAELILRGGLAVATASTGNAQFGTIISSYERLTDLLLAPANHTTLRVSASTLQQKDNLFFRADLGFDFALDKPAGESTSVYFRGNLAAGIRAPGVDITVELVNLAAVNGNESGIENRFVHTAGFSLRSQGEDQFHIGTVFPLDEGPRGDLWIISAGYQRAMNL